MLFVRNVYEHSICRVTAVRNEQGIEWPGGWAPAGCGSEGRFFKFSTKKCGVLCIFIAKSYTCGQKSGPGRLIDRLGHEEVKHRG